MIVIEKRRLGKRMMQTEEQKNIFPAEQEGLRRLLERASARCTEEPAEDKEAKEDDDKRSLQ